MPRLVVLGGSSVSTPGLLLALRSSGIEQDLEVVLHGRSREKLATVARACRMAARDIGISIIHETDLSQALEGADVILNQIRVGGLQGREFDEQFPPTLGLIGEETLGAGGFCNALRTIPVVLEMCHVIQQVAPNAIAVNLTNPANLVNHAITRYMRIKTVSICDIPVTLTGWIAKVLGVSARDLEVDYVGTNHLGWVVAARDLSSSGRDRLGEVLDRTDEIPGFPFDNTWVRALGVLPGSYLRYLYARERYERQPVPTRTRATELIDAEAAMIEAYADLPEGGEPDQVLRIVSQRAPHWYAEIVVPLLTALVSVEPQRHVVQIANCGVLPFLDDDDTIEIPSEVSCSGIHSRPVGALPFDCRALLIQNAAYERLAVEAIAEQNYGKALRALVANPLVGTVEKAEAVLAAVWKLEPAK